jgi:hypothetical protein
MLDITIANNCARLFSLPSAATHAGSTCAAYPVVAAVGRTAARAMGSSSDGEWQHQSREKRHVLLAPIESWNPVHFKFQ